MYNDRNDNSFITLINAGGVALAYGLLWIFLFLSTEVPLATKGYWGMGILLLTISLINVVKYRFDAKSSEDRIHRIEEAKNEKLLENALSEAALLKEKRAGFEARLFRFAFSRGLPTSIPWPQRLG